MFHVAQLKSVEESFAVHVQFSYLCNEFIEMRLLHAISFAMLAVLLAACNPDVFIKEFLAEEPEVLVENGKASVLFKADNWGIWGIVKDSPVSSSGVYATVRDLEGKKIKDLPLEEGKFAVLSVDTDIIDFKIEKRDLHRLDLICGENLEDKPAKYLVEVGNQYERKWITVVFPPSQKYRIDSVVYDWKQFYWSDNTLDLVQSLTLNNTSPEPVKTWFQPYKDAFWTVSSFIDPGSVDKPFDNIFGKERPEIAIPEIVDSLPVPGRTKIRFGERTEQLKTGLDPDLQVEVLVPAGEKRKIEVFLCLEEYSVPFQVYASNPETGRQRVYSGQLHSKRPYDYLILKQRVQDGQTGD